MCGISGIIRHGGLDSTDVSAVQVMTRSMQHRGPDSDGFFSDANVAIGMRRLSILDISGGSQPFYNEDSSVIIIINGEIYNFIELRFELEKTGHTFRTKSDCEVVVHAYEEYGNEFLNKLRGMFSFCLYDIKRHKVILGRDRIGEKPLYVLDDGFSIRFASEMKTLLITVDRKQRILDPDSVYLYLHYQYVPEPRTIISGIRKIAPGTYLEIDLQKQESREHRYWSFDDIPTIVSDDPIMSIRNILNDIGRLIIRADMPIGISLSGGIDSSSIALLCAQYNSQPMHAFSLGYPGDLKNDERQLARTLAKNLKMEFHDIEITSKEVVDHFANLVWSLDDPIADISAHAYFAIAREARRAGVPVLLGGFGGDELFWGYEWTRRSVGYNKLKRCVIMRLNLFIQQLLQQRPTSANFFEVSMRVFQRTFGKGYIFYDLDPGFSGFKQSVDQICTKEFLSTVACGSAGVFFSKQTFDDPEFTSCKLIHELWLMSNCLPLGDRLNMAHSIEFRLPLVDYRLIEGVVGLRRHVRGDYKLGQKRWLVEAMKDLLPQDVIERKKRGFTPPSREWLASLINEYGPLLKNGNLVQSNIVNKSFILSAMKEPSHWGNVLYRLLVLEVWISLYVNGDKLI